MADRPAIDLKRIHDLTVEEVLACLPFSHCTEEEAIEIIDTLKRFTIIIYDYCQKKTRKIVDKFVLFA